MRSRTSMKRSLWIAVALLLAFIAVLGVFFKDIGAARSRVSTGSELAETRCGLIEYAVRGQGPAVLIVHGAGGGFDQGLLFAEPIAQAGFRAIAVSRFG